jgi:hypothetical protein
MGINVNRVPDIGDIENMVSDRRIMDRTAIIIIGRLRLHMLLL